MRHQNPAPTTVLVASQGNTFDPRRAAKFKTTQSKQQYGPSRHTYLSQASFALQAHALFFATTARNHVLWRIPDNHRCRWQSGFVNGLINWNAVRSVNRNGNGSVHGSVDNVHLLLDFDVWTNNRLNNWWLVLNHHTCWGDDWNTLLGGLWGFIWLRLGTRNWKRLTNRHRLGNWWGNGSSHRGGSGNKGTIALWFQRWWRRRTISMFVLLRCLRQE